MVLLILDSHPVQYRVPIYRSISRRLAASGAELRVLYASNSSVRGAHDQEFGQTVAWDEPMLEGYAHEFLPAADRLTPRRFFDLRGGGLEVAMRRIAPDVVLLNGLDYLLFNRAFAWCVGRRVPVWLRSETQDSAYSRGRLKGVLRSILYRGAYAAVDRFFPIGELNAAHYRTHGVPESKLTFCRYCVVDRFTAPTEKLDAQRMKKRAELGLAPELTVIMFSGKLIEKKSPVVLIDAIETMTTELRRPFALLYVGSGEQDSMLRERARTLGVPVIFAGFINQSAIADYYLASDAVILPSRQMGETWGLVANEALLAGKPLILSRHAGSSADFANFAGVQVIEPVALEVAAAFRRLSEQPRGPAVRDQMGNYSIESAGKAIAETFLNCRPKKH